MHFTTHSPSNGIKISHVINDKEEPNDSNEDEENKNEERGNCFFLTK